MSTESFKIITRLFIKQFKLKFVWTYFCVIFMYTFLSFTMLLWKRINMLFQWMFRRINSSNFLLVMIHSRVLYVDVPCLGLLLIRSAETFDQ